MSTLRVTSVSIHPASSLGGMQTVARWLGSTVARAGYEHQFLCAPASVLSRNPMVYALAGQLWQTWRLSREVARRREQTDLFIVHAPAGRCAGPGLTIFHLDLWGYTHGAYPRWNPNHWKLRMINHGLERQSARGPRRTIAVSKTQADGLRSMGIAVDEVVYNPVDTELFKPAPDRDLLRRRLQWPEEKVVALSVGRFYRGKGWGRLLGLARRFPSVMFYFAGPRQLGASVLPSNCKPLGFVPPEKLPELYGAADLFVSLSRAEGFGNALVEAMSAGLPYVANPTGLGGDLKAEGGALSRGITDRDDPDEAETFGRVVESPALRAEMGQAAREFALERAAEPKIAKVYLDLLRAGADRL